jgi:hypothetical protein
VGYPFFIFYVPSYIAADQDGGQTKKGRTLWVLPCILPTKMSLV